MHHGVDAATTFTSCNSAMINAIHYVSRNVLYKTCMTFIIDGSDVLDQEWVRLKLGHSS